MNENIKVTYDTVDDYFSFITPDENNLTIESSVTLDSLKGKVVLINFGLLGVVLVGWKYLILMSFIGIITTRA